MLDEDQAIIMTNFSHAIAFNILIKYGKWAGPAKTAHHKYDRRMVWDMLMKVGLCQHFDYCDQRLFNVIDKVLYAEPT